MEEILSKLKHNSKLKSYHPEQGYVYLKNILERISDLKKALSPQEFLNITLENKSFFENSEEIIDRYFSQTISKKKLSEFKNIIGELKNINFVKTKKRTGFKSIKESIILSLNEAIQRSIKSQKTKYL